MDFLLADADVTTKVGKYVMYVLAVAGGYMVGSILTLVLCRLAAKLVFKRRIYEQLERALRIIGGVIVAVLVAYLLFHFGSGWGLGGTGSGEGEGSGGAAPNQSNQDAGKQTDPKSPDVETVISSVVQVRIEKATDYPRTFRFKGDAEAIDLATAKKRLVELAKTVKGEPRLELHVYQNSTESGHPDVKELIDHAHSLRFSTRVDKLNDRLP